MPHQIAPQQQPERKQAAPPPRELSSSRTASVGTVGYEAGRQALSPRNKPTIGAHRGAPGPGTARASGGVTLGAHRNRDAGPVATSPGPATGGSTGSGPAPGTLPAPVPLAGTQLAGASPQALQGTTGAAPGMTEQVVLAGSHLAPGSTPPVTGEDLGKAAGRVGAPKEGPGDAMLVSKKHGGGAQPQVGKGSKFQHLTSMLSKPGDATAGAPSLDPDDYASESDWARVVIPEDDPAYQSTVQSLRAKYARYGTTGSINAAYDATRERIRMAHERYPRKEKGSRQVL